MFTKEEAVAGYDFGRVTPSPVTIEELEGLKAALAFGDSDHEALRSLWDVVRNDLEGLFERWMGRIAHFFAPTFAGADGRPDEAYMAATHPRFLRWIEDTCTRPYDADWLAYQHEIGLRHHRSKKNETDGVASSVDVVPYRWLPVTVAPMTEALDDYLRERGLGDEDRRALVRAWTRSLLLQVSLWSRPYVREEDW